MNLETFDRIRKRTVEHTNSISFCCFRFLPQISCQDLKKRDAAFAHTVIMAMSIHNNNRNFFLQWVTHSTKGTNSFWSYLEHYFVLPAFDEISLKPLQSQTCSADPATDSKTNILFSSSNTQFYESRIWISQI